MGRTFYNCDRDRGAKGHNRKRYFGNSISIQLILLRERSVIISCCLCLQG